MLDTTLLNEKVGRAYKAHVTASIAEGKSPQNFEDFARGFVAEGEKAKELEKALVITPELTQKLKVLGWDVTEYEKLAGREAGETFPYAKRAKGAEATALQNTDFIRLTVKNMTEQRKRVMHLLALYDAVIG